MPKLRFDSPVSATEFIFGRQYLPGGEPAAQDATAAGTGVRTAVGTGTPASAAATLTGIGARGLDAGAVTLTAQASIVSGVGSSTGDVSVALTIATSRNLQDQAGVSVGVITDIEWEWYDTPGSSSGNPVDSGLFTTNASGEATITVNNSVLSSGQYGQLFIFHPSDPDIRAVLRVPVT